MQLAEALGMQYITITDHSPSAHYARGVELERLEAEERCGPLGVAAAVREENDPDRHGSLKTWCTGPRKSRGSGSPGPSRSCSHFRK